MVSNTSIQWCECDLKSAEDLNKFNINYDSEEIRQNNPQEISRRVVLGRVLLN